MPRLIYTLLLYLLLPLTPLKLLWRGLRQPEYRQHWGERFGYYRSPRPQTQPLIWLHCVSVGETRGAAPLVRELQARHPHHRILLTHATPTGREAGEQLFGDQVERAYLPYDVPGAVHRFLQHYRPAIGLLMETELWFNLIAACKARGIPLLLVNGRMSAKSARGYARFGRLTAQGLGNLAAVAAQTQADAERLQTLGANNPLVLGNLKFDVTPPPQALEQGALLRAKLGRKRPLLLAASTREGEEALILDAVAAAQVPQLLTVIVPRHPQRFDEVAELLRKRNIAFLRKSELDATPAAALEQAGYSDAAHKASDSVMARNQMDVLLGDSMGEMFTYYTACDAAFIGGSLLPYGGQNLIEACAVGKPVLIGPHTYNFTAAAEQAITAEAALRVQDVQGLAQALQVLFNDAEKRQQMGEAGLAFSSGSRGATTRIADLVSAHLPASV